MKSIKVFVLGLLFAYPGVGVLAQNESSFPQEVNTDTLWRKLEQVMADEYTGDLYLSVAEAQEYAVTQNRSLQNASLEVRKAHAQRWQTIASMLPQASGAVAYNDMFGYKADFQGREISMPAYVNHSVTASMTLSGQMIVAALLNNLAIEMQDITREQTESDLRGNVLESYLSVLVLEDVVALLDSSMNNMNVLAAQTLKAVEVGAAEQTDYDKIIVRVNSLKNSIGSTRRSLRLAYDALRVLLDVDSHTQLHLTNTIAQMLSAENALGILLEPYNIHNNFNYQLLEKNVDMAKHNVTMAGLAYVPSVTAAYVYTNKVYLSNEMTFNMQPPHMLQVNVNIPIWSSGNRAAAVTEKKIALQEAENTFSETKDNLDIQYQNLRYQLVNAYETYINQRDNRDVTNRVMNNMTTKYQWGAASSLELVTASNDLISAQQGYVNAVLTLVQARVALEKFLNNK